MVKVNFKSPMIPLLLLVLIDHIGFGIFFPILVPVFMDNQGILGPDVSELTKSFWYNITLAVFPITLYFGAIFLGGLSDQFGRKKILMVCLTGTIMSYFLAGFSIDWKCLSLLISSRAFAGLTSGSMPIAQAAIVDISSEKNRAGNLGLVIFIASVGFLLGPLLGGIFTNTRIMPWFSYSTPFYVASLLAFINLCFIVAFFKETFVPKVKQKFKWIHCVELISAPFIVKQIRFLSCVFLFLQLGWGFYFQFIAVFLLKKHQFTAQDISLFMTFMGLGFAVGSVWATRVLASYFSDVTVAMAALLIAALCFFHMSLGDFGLLNWISAFIVGTTMSILYSLMIKFFSLTVSSEEQGWVMGVSEAIVSIAWAVTPLLATYLENIALALPLQVGTVLLILTVVLLRFWKLPRSSDQSSLQEA